jgi:hypothetical protein
MRILLEVAQEPARRERAEQVELRELLGCLREEIESQGGLE